MKSAILAFALTIINCWVFSQSKLTSLNVTYVDCSIETVIAIPCNLFVNQFSKEKKYLNIKASVNKFIKINRNHIDVRGKIDYILNDRKYQYCFDCFGVFTDGAYFYINTPLFKLLKSKCKELNY